MPPEVSEFEEDKIVEALLRAASQQMDRAETWLARFWVLFFVACGLAGWLAALIRRCG